MGIFKKKDKRGDGELPGLPDLPPAKVSYGFNSAGEQSHEEESHTLPAFPDSPTHNKFSQAAIKDAVGEEDESDLTEVPRDSKNIKVVEMEEWHHPKHEAEHFGEEDVEEDEVDEMPERRERAEPKPTPSEVRRVVKGAAMSRDVFVKIDKFRSARKALEDISGKLEEIDEMIKKIREVKLREDQELGAWERDITHVKARIGDVSESIFEKLE